MELIIFVAVLCVAAVLAMRFGYDSRAPAPSKEEDLADLGLSLDQAGTASRDVPRKVRLRQLDLSINTTPQVSPFRRSVARALRALVG